MLFFIAQVIYTSLAVIFYFALFYCNGRKFVISLLKVLKTALAPRRYWHYESC